MDTQVIEMLGRNRLIDELLRAGLEVALPERDRGIDLIAYADLESKVASFVARPIQMKAASEEHFSVFRKYGKFPGLILAFVWNLARPDQTRTYALTYAEALEIAGVLGWTQTPSWARKNGYNTQKPSKRMKEILCKYEMTPKRWWKMVVSKP